jgi:hypothetical protein
MARRSCVTMRADPPRVRRDRPVTVCTWELSAILHGALVIGIELDH